MNLLISEENEVKDWLLQKKEASFRARQILDWLYQKSSVSFQEMSNLSKGLREKLEESFSISTIELYKLSRSKDNETEKFLFKLQDEKLIEAVLIYSGKRRTLCISSQVGCPARCSFCASGKNGLIRNLSTEEILSQALLVNAELAKKEEKISHIVFMGMGEPLENTEALIKAIKKLNDPKAFNISARRITVSTVGVVEGIERLEEENLRVNLVLSLHAPNQHLRKKIIPYARKYHLDTVLAAMDRYSRKTKRDITFEYILLKGINDGEEEARELIHIARKRQCCINLIPYNPVEGIRLARPENKQIKAFQELLQENGINCTCRYTKGDDINAACGQLAQLELETLKQKSPAL